jgi:Recombination enhancement, RecA-dependent nuclease
MGMMLPKPKRVEKPKEWIRLRPRRKGKEGKGSSLKAHRKPPAKPTAAQKARWEAMKQIGCVACRQYRVAAPNDLEIHHLNEGGQAGRKRRGHDFTVCLCQWHHQGIRPAGMGGRDTEWSYGPSLKLASKDFRRTFGTDDQLLEYQNGLIAGER